MNMTMNKAKCYWRHQSFSSLDSFSFLSLVVVYFSSTIDDALQLTSYWLTNDNSKDSRQNNKKNFQAILGSTFSTVEICSSNKTNSAEEKTIEKDQTLARISFFAFRGRKKKVS